MHKFSLLAFIGGAQPIMSSFRFSLVIVVTTHSMSVDTHCVAGWLGSAAGYSQIICVGTGSAIHSKLPSCSGNLYSKYSHIQHQQV